MIQSILQSLASRHQPDLAVIACMWKLVHSCCCCHHFSRIMCIVHTTCAGFNCHIKCLQKDYAMIQYWKENLQCIQRGKETEQQGINLLFVKWIFIRRELIVMTLSLAKKSKNKNPSALHLLLNVCVHGPTTLPGRLLEMQNLRLCHKALELGRNEKWILSELPDGKDFRLPTSLLWKNKFPQSFIMWLQETNKPSLDSDTNGARRLHKKSPAPR